MGPHSFTWGFFSINFRRGWEGKSTPRQIHIFKFRYHRMEANSAKCIYFKFHDHTFIGEFSMANLSFGCKGVMYLVDFPEVLAAFTLVLSAFPNIKYLNCTFTANL